MSSAVAHSFAPVGVQYDVYTSPPVIAPSKIAPPVMTPVINAASLVKGPGPEVEGEFPYSGGTMGAPCNVSLAPDNIAISSFPASRENGMNVANGESQICGSDGGEQKSDVDDTSSTDETVLAEPGSPYDLVAPVPLPTDATAAQMLTEQAVSQINAALEHTDHAQVTCPASRQGNKCLDCRKCWDRGTSRVIYGKH